MTTASRVWTACLALVAALVLSQPASSGITLTREDIAILVENSSTLQQIDQNLVLPDTIRVFVERIARDVRVALILFNENAILKVPFTSVTGDEAGKFRQGLNAIDYSGQHANSAAALERALHELKSTSHRGAGKSIILITRGNIHTGNEKLDASFSQWLSDVLAIDAAEARIRIFCIAVSATPENGLMKGLARKTGGSFYRVASEDELQDAFRKLTNDILSRAGSDFSGY